MAWASAKRTIDAPAEEVFNTVAHIKEFRKALPHIIDVELLTDQQTGAGTRFRETRLMNGKKYVTELEVTEYQPHARVRMVTDTNGTIWDTLYTIDQRDGQTRLQLNMDAKAHKLIAKLVNHFIQGFVQHAIDRDMDLVKQYCEHEANHRDEHSA
jgi:carbon monoxide dehydrogenase subunit G